MKLIQIAGYKNSGKTTLVTRILKMARKSGINVSSLKHHGHGGLPLGLEEKDSMLHREAGAMIAGVEGAGVLQFTRERPWELEDLVNIYQLLDVELLIIEGFKQADYEKVVLIRDEADLHLLEQLNHIVAVMTTLPIGKRYQSLPVFHPEDYGSLLEWIVEEWYKKQQ